MSSVRNRKLRSRVLYISMILALVLSIMPQALPGFETPTAEAHNLQTRMVYTFFDPDAPGVEYRREIGGDNGVDAFGLGAVKPGLGALDQLVTLELSDGVDDVHRQLARRAGQINAAKREAMHPHSARRHAVYGGAHVHCVAAKPVQLRNNDDVPRFQSICQPCFSSSSFIICAW